MKSHPIKIDHISTQIVLNRSFATKANKYGTAEYSLLNKARKDYPQYTVTIRAEIKKNPQKECLVNLLT